MSLDYPDSFEHVERTPIQKLDYQIFGIRSAENQNLAASSTGTSIWNIPDDGYYYLIDTIFFIVNHFQPFDAFLDLANDQAAPSWYTLANKRGKGDLDLIVSRMGSFSLKYPRAVRFRVYNYRTSTIQWSVFCNYFKYVIEV
jgi:hypothetical protein